MRKLALLLALLCTPAMAYTPISVTSPITQSASGALGCPTCVTGAAGTSGQVQYNNSGALAGTGLIVIGTSGVTIGSSTFTQTINGNISGNAATVTTNANLTGDVTSVGNTTSILSTVVTGKVLTGFSANAGTVSASDTILTAFNKVVGNINALVSGVSSVFGRTGVVTAQTGDYTVSQVTGAAPINNAAFTGTFSAPTGTITNSMLAGSIAASKLVGTDIDTVGTLTSGTWNATPISLTTYASGTLQAAQEPAHTGDMTNSSGSLTTAVNSIGGKAVTLGGAFTMSGAFAFTGTLTGVTSVTFPTSGTLATTAGTVSSFSAGTTGLTPSGSTTGAVTLAGTLIPANGGTGCSGTQIISSGASTSWNGTACTVVWNSTTTSTKALSITGCTSALTGRRLTIKDKKGTANLYSIIITPGSGTADGLSTAVVGEYKASKTLECDGVSDWMVM